MRTLYYIVSTLMILIPLGMIILLLMHLFLQ